jgi:hypothetical protein
MEVYLIIVTDHLGRECDFGDPDAQISGENVNFSSKLIETCSLTNIIDQCTFCNRFLVQQTLTVSGWGLHFSQETDA